MSLRVWEPLVYRWLRAPPDHVMVLKTTVVVDSYPRTMTVMMVCGGGADVCGCVDWRCGAGWWRLTNCEVLVDEQCIKMT